MSKENQNISRTMKRSLFPVLLAALAIVILSQMIHSMPVTGALARSLAVNRPFPQHETYATGTIRPTNFTQAQQDQHVRDFYDYWKASYVVSAGTNSAGKEMYRVTFGTSDPSSTVSEGQGYGMVTVALMAGHDADAQTVFDGLWYFARTYPSGADSRLMSWKIQNGQIVSGNNSAFDGDVDIAYGLLLADAQWGSVGEIDYKAEADTVMAGILESTIGANSRLPKLGDWTSDNGSPYSQYTPRSSDFMPSHFRAFARATNDTTWETVISNSQAVIDQIQANQSATTGLLPDFIINCNPVSNCTPANSRFLEGSHDGHYYYNAGRDPWRMGLDALLNGDATSKTQVDKMVSWVNSNSGGDANNIKAGYQLNGSAIGNYFTTFFVAPFGVGAMLDASQQSFLNDIYAKVYNTREDYYEDSVNMLALLAMTGNYWDPTADYTPPATSTPASTNTPGPSPTASNTPIEGSNTPTAAATATATSITSPTATVSPTASNTPQPTNGSCAIDVTINQWNTGFTANVVINNNTGAEINGWTLTWSFSGNQQITNLWNGQHSQNGNQVTVSNASYNGVIPHGGTQNFGFQATYSGPNGVPTDFVLNGTPCDGPAPTPTPVPPTGPLCSVEYVINSDWGVGFVTDVEITNNSGSDWHEWTLTWSFSGNQQVTNLWNGSHTQNGNQVTAQNASWNGNVLYGERVRFGFQGSYSGNNERPTSFTVNGIDCNTVNATPTSTPAANAPSINELLPDQGQNDLPNEINLFGRNFQADSRVSLNLGSQAGTNVPLESTFISATQLRVVIPAGLLAQTYDITVNNSDGTQGTLANVYIVTDAPQDDLLSYDTQLWSVPAALHAGDEAQIGLHLYRQGGTETLSNVKVNFYLRDASASPQLIGSGEVPLLAPSSSSHTTAVNWTVPAAGDYTLIAIIDEANDISEADESNNVLMREITIMAAAEDVTPPSVDRFTINGGATETAQQDVNLSITASDPTGATPSSDVESLFIIEYEFNQSLKQWIPANLSDWLAYSASPSTYSWSLLPSAGVKHLQVWARDGAGNISLASRSAMINYVPTSATLATGLSHFYAYHLSAGQTITAAITPISGDPDLYIWPANGAENAFSINGESEVDQATFTATVDGTYLLQVHAYQRAQYSLSVTIGNSKAKSHRNQQVQGKTPLSAPRLAPDELPQDLTYALPSTPTTPTTGGNKVYLPLLTR